MLAYFPSWSCLFSAIAILLLLPPLKSTRERYIKRPAWIGALIACFILVLALAPTPASAPKNAGMDTATAQSDYGSRAHQPEADNLPAPSPAPTIESIGNMATAMAATPIVTVTPTPTDTPEPTPPAPSVLTVHFLDVGQADAILLQCDGHAMLVDGGNKADGQFVVAYLKKQGIESLDYVVNTHPHEDHVGGLAGVMNAFSVERVYANVMDDDSDDFQYFKKYVEKAGLEIASPANNEVWSLGRAKIKVLSAGSEEYAGNNASIVLKIQHGGNSFLLMGDAEADAEKALLSSGCDLRATVLKVGHHGNDLATGYQFLREVMPKYAVISVGADNSYGHPAEGTLSRLDDAGAQILRTDLNGTIVMESDEWDISVRPEREATKESLLLPILPAGSSEDADEREAPAVNQKTERAAPDEDPWPSGDYIGNKKTKKFHKPSCGTLPDEKNRVYFDTTQEAKKKGYVPCKKCKP